MTSQARAAYMDASVTTASPARLLVMLYERLVLDVRRGLEAQRVQNHQESHLQLTHAQDIVMELQSSLKAEMFAGGEDLAALYGYLHRQLIIANVRKNAEITEHCLMLVTDLCDTWRQAAEQALQTRSA